MSRLLGIDATKTTVRAAVVRTAYRRVTLEALGEADIAWAGSEVEAIRSAVGGLRADACAIALPGERTFHRKLDLPAAAAEGAGERPRLRARVDRPLRDGARPSSTTAPSAAPTPRSSRVFAVLARTEDVRARISLVREALGIEPERVGSGALPLANLMTVMPELEKPPGTALKDAGPVAILDVGDHSSELVVLLGGEAVFARTLSRGTAGLPESAHTLARELRQTLASWRSQGGGPLRSRLPGGQRRERAGRRRLPRHRARASPSSRCLAPRLEGLTPEQAAQLPRFAKALGPGARARRPRPRRTTSAGARSRPSAATRTSARRSRCSPASPRSSRSASASPPSPRCARSTPSTRCWWRGSRPPPRDVLGEEITEPDKAKELLESGPGKADEDPLPRIDGFDVMVQLSKAVPKEIVHDVVDLDVQRSKVVLQGVVPTVADAETIAKNMRDNRCFKDVKVGRTTQFAEGRQKYQLEFELKCEERRRPKPRRPSPTARRSPTPPRQPAVTPPSPTSPTRRRVASDPARTLREAGAARAPAPRRPGVDLRGLPRPRSAPSASGAYVNGKRTDNQDVRDLIDQIYEARGADQRAQGQARRAPGALRQAGAAARRLHRGGRQGERRPPRAESQDLPEVPHGKRYSERSTRRCASTRSACSRWPRRWRRFEQSGYPVAVTRLNIKPRSGEPDSYEVELGVSAFDRKADAPAAPPAAAAPRAVGPRPTRRRTSEGAPPPRR